MRLGFDLDGTLADLQGALAREARVIFPDLDPQSLPRSASATEPSPATEDDDTTREQARSGHTLNRRRQREIWSAATARENFWETLDEIEPGALARLYHLAQARRWEVIFLTSRPDSVGETAQTQSHRWLSAHGFQSPSVFVVHGSRGKIASALQLDVLVDDRPENCLDVAIDSSARAILVWRGGEENVPDSARQLGIGAVKSIGACLDILEAIDRDGEAAGVLDRLKRLLGLRPRTTRLQDPPARPPVEVAGR